MKTTCLCLAAGILLSGVIWATENGPGDDTPVDYLEFIDAPIAQILIGLGQATGNTVVADATVTGSATIYFSNTTFLRALTSITTEHDLYLSVRDGVYRVSAVEVRVRPGSRPGSTPLVTVRTREAQLAEILRRLSQATAIPILFSEMPPATTTYYGADVPLDHCIRQLVGLIPGHQVRSESHGYRVVPVGPGARSDGSATVTESSGGFNLHVDAGPLQSVLAELFRAGGHEYQMLSAADHRTVTAHFENKGFGDLLRLIMEQVDCEAVLLGGIYYVVDGAPLAGLPGAMVTRILRTSHLSVAEVVELLPVELTTGLSIRQGRHSGYLTITGSPQSVSRVEELVSAVDVGRDLGAYYQIRLSSLNADRLQLLLPASIDHLEVLPTADPGLIVVQASQTEHQELLRFLAATDVEISTIPLSLDHIQVDDLMGNLPATVTPSQIHRTPDPTRFRYTGSASQQDTLILDLEEIDQQVPQITYHLLLIQYQKGRRTELQSALNNAIARPDTGRLILGTLGNLLSMKFDIVSAFGYQFAAQLDLQLATSEARIIADTTLTGISGESVEFRNTSTYRYRDTIVDPSTGATQDAGVTREITSGLILQIAGRVSHSGEVSLDLAATISKRGTDRNDAPPATSERTIRTTVRTQAGVPVLVGGMLHQEHDVSTSGPPILAQIPVIRRILGSRTVTQDSTELAIYVVPQIARASETEDPAAEIERIYRSLVEGQQD